MSAIREGESTSLSANLFGRNSFLIQSMFRAMAGQPPKAGQLFSFSWLLSWNGLADPSPANRCETSNDFDVDLIVGWLSRTTCNISLDGRLGYFLLDHLASHWDQEEEVIHPSFLARLVVPLGRLQASKKQQQKTTKLKKTSLASSPATHAL